jgi:hypothetical protein
MLTKARLTMLNKAANDSVLFNPNVCWRVAGKLAKWLAPTIRATAAKGESHDVQCGTILVVNNVLATAKLARSANRWAASLIIASDPASHPPTTSTIRKHVHKQVAI